MRRPLLTLAVYVALVSPFAVPAWLAFIAARNERHARRVDAEIRRQVAEGWLSL